MGAEAPIPGGHLRDPQTVGAQDYATAERRAPIGRADAAAVRDRPHGDPGSHATALAHSDAECDAATSFLAHDLSEGLGTIELFAGALETYLGDDLSPAAVRSLGGIRAGMERMHSLIDAEIGFPGASGGVERHRPLDANVLARDALANVHARVAQTAAEIACEPLPWVFGDGPQLTRLLQNLLANSLKFRDPLRPVRIRVRARRERGRWRFEIADNGIGIAPEIAERAFDPSRRRLGVEVNSGSGLGLSICARIVRAHGGHARAESRAGGGTTVSFDLPSASTGEPGPAVTH